MDDLTPFLDAALEAEQKAQPHRKYLGGSIIGGECERAIQFDFFNAPKDPGKDFSGRILRVFERGHWVEAAVIRWLRMAGVEIQTEDASGCQFGFAEHDGLFRGHCDGIITGGPVEFGPFPRLWENKGLKTESWRALTKHGLRKDKPVYYAQCQVYMQKFNLIENPALFTAVNLNSMEIYWEAIPYNPAAAAMLNAKAARILQNSLAGELLPRLSQDPSFFKCKMCSWQKKCGACK